jgi:hypothetical protein
MGGEAIDGAGAIKQGDMVNHILTLVIGQYMQ